jgi:hypothetical protein
MREAIANRVGELLRTRAAFILDDDDCLAWFGVGRATLERIEAGEVEPEPEVMQRVDRFLRFCGGSHPFTGSPPLPPSVVTHAGGALAGGASNGPAGSLEGQA